MPRSVCGGWAGLTGLKAGSSPPSTVRRRVSSHSKGPTKAAAVTAMRTLNRPAIWPHSSEPPAAPPISATWYTAMPRARTQFGSAICAASVSELAVEIQAMPSTAIAGSAIHKLGANTATTDIAACTSVPYRTNWSRL